MKTKNPQLFFFTGENTYALQTEMRRWKQTFLEKHGEANLQQVTDVKALDWVTFSASAKVMPFASEKRLLILDGTPAVTKEECERLVAEMHEGTVLLIGDPLPDRRKSIVKFLLKEATVRSFPLLPKRELVSWISALGRSQGIAVPEESAGHLIDLVGNDQWTLEQECRKVLAFAAPSAPTTKDIDRVCLPSGTHAVWVMNDLIGKGKVEEAALYGSALWESGEPAFALWNLFLYTVRSIVTLWAWQREKGNLPPAALAKASGVNIRSVYALLPFVRGLTEERMLAIVASAAQADRALKIGEIRASAEHSIELVTLIERQIVGLKGSHGAPPRSR